MSEMELGSRDNIVAKAGIEHTVTRLLFQERQPVQEAQDSAFGFFRHVVCLHGIYMNNFNKWGITSHINNYIILSILWEVVSIIIYCMNKCNIHTIDMSSFYICMYISIFFSEWIFATD